MVLGSNDSDTSVAGRGKWTYSKSDNGTNGSGRMPDATRPRAACCRSSVHLADALTAARCCGSRGPMAISKARRERASPPSNDPAHRSQSRGALTTQSARRARARTCAGADPPLQARAPSDRDGRQCDLHSFWLLLSIAVGAALFSRQATVRCAGAARRGQDRQYSARARHPRHCRPACSAKA